MSSFTTISDTQNEYRIAKPRLLHIDWLRGIAVLLMVMVHAAATWQPKTISSTSLLAYVVSGLGGLAAPLFVVLTGWGLSRSKLSSRRVIVRVVFFFIMQIILNLSAPHLFDTFTPGVLTLFALLTLSAPLWKRLSNTSVILIMLILLFIPSIIVNPGSWGDRVEVEGIEVFILHLFWTGTYPFVPWLIFALLGHLIARKVDAPFFALMSAGFLLMIGSIRISLSQQIAFASPSGVGVLTFFPANTPFLIGAMLGVGLIWMCVENYCGNWQPMSDLGQRSLTVYILHFIPFFFLHQLDESGGWSALTCGLVVFGYTLLWLPAMHYCAKHMANLSFEKILQHYSAKR
jgi:surface polysaccharide O-acyltransferase-like enzyme